MGGGRRGRGRTTQQLFAVILSIFFIFMTKRWALCTGLAIRSFIHSLIQSVIHSGQRAEFVPIWETEINEKPRVLLILTTSVLSPGKGGGGIELYPAAEWRGVAAKQNLIAEFPRQWALIMLDGIPHFATVTVVH